MPSHGAFRLALPWFKSSPREGDPIGKPKPKKSSPVKVVMDPASVNGIKVMVAIIAFGNTCLKISEMSDTPKARAARTKSRFRARRNSARTTPTKPIQLKSSKRPNSHQKLGVIMLAIIISR